MSKTQKRAIEISLISKLKEISPNLNKAIRELLNKAKEMETIPGITMNPVCMDESIIIGEKPPHIIKTEEMLQIADTLLNNQSYMEKMMQNFEPEIQRMIDRSIESAKRGEY